MSVDARGYAFVLFEMLRRNGLSVQNYSIETAGGMVQRREALRTGMDRFETLLTGILVQFGSGLVTCS